MDKYAYIISKWISKHLKKVHDMKRPKESCSYSAPSRNKDPSRGQYFRNNITILLREKEEEKNKMTLNKEHSVGVSW